MTQIAVKLPDALVAQIDALVATGAYPSRSSVVRLALETTVAAERHRLEDLAFEVGYRASPDTEEELAQATRLAVAAIHEEPWEPWW